jgi:hypothetical protein
MEEIPGKVATLAMDQGELFVIQKEIVGVS